MLAPSGTTQGFENIYSGASSCAEVVNVEVEGEEGIERHPQDSGVPFQREGLVVEVSYDRGPFFLGHLREEHLRGTILTRAVCRRIFWF